MITQHKYNEEMVSCIMGTYGNFDVACEALTCFLHQDYHNKELIIVNHHEVPINFTHPQVTVLNLKPEEVPTLRHVKMVGIQKSNGRYIAYAGSSNTHGHGFTHPSINLNVKYHDVIIATKD